MRDRLVVGQCDAIWCAEGTVVGKGGETCTMTEGVTAAALKTPASEPASATSTSIMIVREASSKGETVRQTGGNCNSNSQQQRSLETAGKTGTASWVGASKVSRHRPA